VDVCDDEGAHVDWPILHKERARVKLGSVPNLIVVPEGEDQLKYRVEKSAQVGLSCMGVFVRPEMMDAAYLESVAELAEERGIELRGGGGGNFYLEGDEARAEVERVAERLTFLARHLGIRYSSLASGPMLTHHRFADGAPLERRKATLSKNLAALADAVAVPLGEGHVDNVAICEILAKEAPDPKSIALIIEPFYVPDGADVNAFFETSVAWAKKHLARFLS
jgi:sugar phosphate isomerase/epimerase